MQLSVERRRMYGSKGSSEAIDLSMVDNAGDARQSMTTANCYLVHAAGNYKIPLVYGNAIKNGTVNTMAFNPGSVSYELSRYGLIRFLNHEGTGITGPWITKSGSGVDAGMGLAAASAELLWQDAPGLVSRVSAKGDYLYFTIGSYTPGNALIAIKDSSNNIMWSWHIWATSETLASTTSIYPIYEVAPVNLGWVPTGGDGTQGYCPYYQWGRKDPFIPSTGSENTDHTVYNISNNSVTGLTYQASDTATIADNIKNPTYFYYNSSTYGPVATTYYNMWDAQCSSHGGTGNITTATKKTIYDPCPPGFCVPTGGLYYWIKDNYQNNFIWDSTKKGRTWASKVFFPTSGDRAGNYIGSLYNVGSYGIYWSALPGGSTYGKYIYGYYFSFYSRQVFWNTNGDRAMGYSVRPVKE